MPDLVARERSSALLRRLHAAIVLWGVLALLMPLQRSVRSDSAAPIADPVEHVRGAPPQAAAPPPSPAPVPVVERIETTEPVVFLTIDDGWSIDPRVLDLVAALRLPVSVFPVGAVVAADPGTWRRFVAAGATVETHTVSHPELDHLSPEAQRNEVCGGADHVRAATGLRARVLRPPFGRLSAELPAIAPACDLDAIVLWSAEMRGGQLSFRRPQSALRSGDIVLLHFRPELFDELNALLAELGRLGLRPAPLRAFLFGPSPRSSRPPATPPPA